MDVGSLGVKLRLLFTTVFFVLVLKGTVLFWRKSL